MKKEIANWKNGNSFVSTIKNDDNYSHSQLGTC